MSGNVRIADAGEIVGGEPFDVKLEDPRDVRHTILAFLTGVSNVMLQQYDKHLFGRAAASLLQQTCFAGSSQLLMSNIPRSILMKTFGKRYFGDVDVLIDKKFVKAGGPLQDHALARGMVHGNCIVVGNKRVGQNLHVIIQDVATAKYRQIDFLGCDYDEQNAHPSEFAQWATSAAKIDLASGMSGVFHKLLMNACVKSIHEIDGEIRDARGKFKQEGPFNAYTLSVQMGMRIAHVTDGVAINNNGARVELIRRVEARHNPQYVTDLRQIATLTFGDPKADIQSLFGLCMSMLCHMSEERQAKTVAYFKDNLDNNKEIEPKLKAKAYKFVSEFFKPQGVK